MEHVKPCSCGHYPEAFWENGHIVFHCVNPDCPERYMDPDKPLSIDRTLRCNQADLEVLSYEIQQNLAVSPEERDWDFFIDYRKRYIKGIFGNELFQKLLQLTSLEEINPDLQLRQEKVILDILACILQKELELPLDARDFETFIFQRKKYLKLVLGAEALSEILRIEALDAIGKF